MFKFKIEQLKVEIGNTIMSAVVGTVRNITWQHIYLYTYIKVQSAYHDQSCDPYKK